MVAQNPEPQLQNRYSIVARNISNGNVRDETQNVFTKLQNRVLATIV